MRVLLNWVDILNNIFESGLTQMQCAALWGVGQTTVSDIARGKTLDPRGSLCMAIMATHTERMANKAVGQPVVAGDALGYDALNDVATKPELKANVMGCDITPQGLVCTEFTAEQLGRLD